MEVSEIMNIYEESNTATGLYYEFFNLFRYIFYDVNDVIGIEQLYFLRFVSFILCMGIIVCVVLIFVWIVKSLLGLIKGIDLESFNKFSRKGRRKK
jgi:hypothetical protein